MIDISNDLSLAQIKMGDHEKLSRLMYQIYPPVYEHLWIDKGQWYLNHLYSKNNIEKEINNPDSRYYFVNYQYKTVGIIRLLLNATFNGMEASNSTKLHRIYLDSSVQGKGLGKRLIQWCESQFNSVKGSALWLEVMDTQELAIKFYEKAGFKIVGRFEFSSELMHANLRGMYIMCKYNLDIK